MLECIWILFLKTCPKYLNVAKIQTSYDCSSFLQKLHILLQIEEL